jgi:hypothetical protein
MICRLSVGAVQNVADVDHGADQHKGRRGGDDQVQGKQGPQSSVAPEDPRAQGGPVP